MVSTFARLEASHTQYGKHKLICQCRLPVVYRTPRRGSRARSHGTAVGEVAHVLCSCGAVLRLDRSLYGLTLVARGVRHRPPACPCTEESVIVAKYKVAR